VRAYLAHAVGDVFGAAAVVLEPAVLRIVRERERERERKRELK
jgi:hypothetical protein